MMALDLPTLMFVSVVISLGTALGFSLILLLLPGERVIQLWASSLWLLAMAMGLLSAQVWLPVGPSVLGANICMALANALLIHGVAIHTGVSRHQRPLVLAVGGYVLAIGWFALIRPDFEMRMHLFSMGLIACDIWVMLLLLCCRAQDILRSRQLAALAFAFHAILYLGQMICLPVHADPTGSIRQGGTPVAFFYVILLLLLLAKCFAMLLLIVERLMSGLRQMARLDGLTELLNHNAILADGQRALQQASRRQRPLSVLLCDLDYFKQINDTWGHQAGDQVLVHIAQLIRESLPSPLHLASRYGGEEFLLVLLDCEMEQAMLVAEQLRQRIEQCPASWRGSPLPVTASIGLGMSDAGSSFEQLIARADTALYCSKRAGRNRVTLFADGPGAPSVRGADALASTLG